MARCSGEAVLAMSDEELLSQCLDVIQQHAASPAKGTARHQPKTSRPSLIPNNAHKSMLDDCVSRRPSATLDNEERSAKPAQASKQAEKVLDRGLDSRIRNEQACRRLKDAATLPLAVEEPAVSSGPQATFKAVPDQDISAHRVATQIQQQQTATASSSPLDSLPESADAFLQAMYRGYVD